MGMRTGMPLRAAVVVLCLVALDQVLSSWRRGQLARVHKEIEQLAALTKETQGKTSNFKRQQGTLKKRVAELRAEIKGLKQRQRRAPAAAAAAAPAPAARVARRQVLGQERRPGFRLNTVVTDPPFCRQRAARKHGQGKLPTFVFVAGVEGSGHHALKDVWWALEASGMKLKLIVYDQVFHSLGIENHASYHYSSIRPETYAANMKPVFDEAAKTGSIVIDAQNSYPMGKGAGALAHPDLVMLSQLDGVLFDLRVIVLYRDPVNATLSAVRRFQNDEEYKFKNHEWQARTVSECLATINNGLAQLPCGKYMAIRYEDLVSAPGQLSSSIGQLLGADPKVIGKAFHKLSPRPPKQDSPETALKRKELKDFFRLQHVMWPLLAGTSS